MRNLIFFIVFSIFSQNIRIIDYEKMVDEKGQRVCAFGKFAGVGGKFLARNNIPKRIYFWSVTFLEACWKACSRRDIYISNNDYVKSQQIRLKKKAKDCMGLPCYWILAF